MNTTPTRIGMSLAEFLEEAPRQPFELINGEKRLIMPTVLAHNLIIRLLFRILDAYVVAQKLGEMFFELTFILPDSYSSDLVKGSRTPDLMFYSGDRVARYMAENPGHGDRPLPLVPDLVIEVISPTDNYNDVLEKVNAYLADGVRMIWLVEPKSRTVTVYEVDEERLLLLRGDATLDGGDVLPGFTLALAQLFARV
jgi:Uma2 family endonuclease